MLRLSNRTLLQRHLVVGLLGLLPRLGRRLGFDGDLLVALLFQERFRDHDVADERGANLHILLQADLFQLLGEVLLELLALVAFQKILGAVVESRGRG